MFCNAQMNIKVSVSLYVPKLLAYLIKLRRFGSNRVCTWPHL